MSSVTLGTLSISKYSLSERTFDVKPLYQIPPFLNTALDFGINYIETGKRTPYVELIMGDTLWQRRKYFTLGSKTNKLTYDEIAIEIADSLLDLKTSFIDIFTLEGIEQVSQLKQFHKMTNGALSALQGAKKNRYINYIGLSSSNIEVLTEAIKMKTADIYTLSKESFTNEDIVFVEKAIKKKNLLMVELRAPIKEKLELEHKLFKLTPITFLCNIENEEMLSILTEQR